MRRLFASLAAFAFAATAHAQINPNSPNYGPPTATAPVTVQSLPKATTVGLSDLLILTHQKSVSPALYQTQQLSVSQLATSLIGPGTAGQTPYWASPGNVLTPEGPWPLGSVILGGGVQPLGSSGPFTAGAAIIGAGTSGLSSVGPFTAGLPIIGDGTAGFAAGTKSGTSTLFLVVDGTSINGQCAVFAASGGVSSTPCATAGSGTVGSGLRGQYGGYAATGTSIVGIDQCQNIETWGGVPNTLTDQTAALTALLAAQSSSFYKCAYFPSGYWYFTGGQTLSLASFQSLIMRGDGSGNSLLIFSSGSRFVINYADFTASTGWHGLSFLTQGVGTTNALTLNQQTSVSNPANSALTVFDDVTFRGADSFGGTDYWANSIVVNQVSNINFAHLQVFGPGPSGWTPNGVGVLLNGGVNSGPDIDNLGVAYNFWGSTFEFIGKGIVYGKDIQGVTVLGSNFTGGYYGVYVNSGSALSTLDQLTVADNQFNDYEAGVEDNSGVTNTLIHDNVMGIPQANGAAVQLNTAAGFSIHDNTCESGVGQASTNCFVIGTVPSGYSGVIHGNYCNGPDTCIFLTSGSSSVTTYGNTILNAANRVVNSGIVNVVSDNTQCSGGFSSSVLVQNGQITHC